MCKQQPTGYFLRLSAGRVDGKKDYLRRPDGKRAILSANEAREAMLDQLCGEVTNLEAQLHPVYNLTPDSEVAAEDQVEQLCSSDGTVISQKIDGKWVDLDRGCDDATWNRVINTPENQLTDDDRKILFLCR